MVSLSDNDLQIIVNYIFPTLLSHRRIAIIKSHWIPIKSHEIPFFIPSKLKQPIKPINLFFNSPWRSQPFFIPWSPWSPWSHGHRVTWWFWAFSPVGHHSPAPRGRPGRSCGSPSGRPSPCGGASGRSVFWIKIWMDSDGWMNGWVREIREIREII
jgi:hypothetical protein